MGELSVESSHALTRFTGWLSRANAAQNTVKSYGKDLADFLDWIGSRGQAITDIQEQTLVDYIVSRKYTKRTTIDRKRSSLAKFVQFWNRREGTKITIPSSSSLKKDLPPEFVKEIQERKYRTIIDDDTFAELINTIRQYEPKGSARATLEYRNARDILCTHLFYSAGGRIGEVANLQCLHLTVSSEEKPIVTVEFDHNNYKKRTASFKPTHGVREVLNYLPLLEEAFRYQVQEKPLLINTRRERLSRRLIRKKLALFGSMIGMPNLSPDNLRSSYFVNQCNAGTSDRNLAERMGILETSVRVKREQFSEHINN